MADPVTIANTGVDPLTGSYLSADRRKAIFKSTRVSGFSGGGDGGGALAIRPQTNLVEQLQKQNSEQSTVNSAQDAQIQQNNQSLGVLQETLNQINNNLSSLITGINNLGQQINAENLEEQKNLQLQQESERKLNEMDVRLGKERILETKITSALAEPIKRIEKKISNVFGDIMGAMTTLFMGWLSNQGIETLKALASGDTEKLNEIKGDIVKNIIASIAVFSGVKAGFSLLMRTISGLSTRIARMTANILTAPFRAAAAGVRAAVSGGSAPRPGGGKPGSPPGGKPGGRFNVLGGILSIASGTLNFLNGEYVDTALNALTITPMGGKFGTAIRVGAGVLVGLDEIAEMLGSNLTGADPKLLRQKREELKKAQEQARQQTQAQTQPAAQPQTPLMGDNKNGTAGVEPNDAGKLDLPPAPQETLMGSPASKEPVMETSIEQEPTMEGSTPPPAPPTPESQPAITGVPEQNLKGLEGEISSLSMPTSNTPTEANIQAPPKPQDPLGTLPELTPNVIIAEPGKNTSQVIPPQEQQSLNDVPFIPSGNSDNFYVLYSQVSYNVVI